METRTLESFCGSTHWNLTLSWETDYYPDLTYCFEETCLLWTPCLLLFLFTCFRVLELNDKDVQNRKHKERERALNHWPDPSDSPIPWDIYMLGNMCIYCSLIIIYIIELVNVFYWNRDYLIQVYPVDWFTPSVKIITLIYLMYLQELYRRHAIYSSGPIFIFALLFAVYNVFNFRTMLLAIFVDSIYYVEINRIQFICQTLATFMSIIHLLFNCFSHYSNTEYLSQRRMQLQRKQLQHHHHHHQQLLLPRPNSRHFINDFGGNSQRKQLLPQPSPINPWITASFPSQITFWWFNRIIWLGYRRPLVENDIFRLDRNNTTAEVLKTFQKTLKKYTADQNRRQQKALLPKKDKNGYEKLSSNEEVDNKKSLAKRINLGIVIIRVYWKMLLSAAIMKLVASLMTFVNPIILDHLITFISTKNEPYWHGLFYATIMLLSPALESIINNQYEFWMSIVVLRVRMSVTSLIYNKSLRMSNHSRSKYSTGEITNIMSVDSQRITEFMSSANMLWSSPIQIAVAFYLLWQQVQVASMAGLGFMILIMPLNSFAMRKMRTFQVDVMRQKDRRTKLMNEVLNGIKVLKLYAWEESFKNLIIKLRDYECAKLYKITLFSGFITFTFVAAPFFVGLLTFATFVLLGNVLDPNKAFVSLSLFSIIRAPLGLFPMLLTTGVQALVSLNRINDYLNSEEQDDRAIRHMPDEECAIRIRDATFTWQIEGPITLKHINLNVQRGRLIAVVGSVGSGKSSLLSAILGDMEKLSGVVNVDGSTAYVPQQAWIQNLTVRKNITFGSRYNEQKYRKVLKCCCLEPDMKMLANGDQTEIGERGINLSGGQKQRISLARAVYADKDIYLLDDPLSAVDAHVGDQLFNNVISKNGLLQNKTRILATHRAMILPEVDEIIVMKDGQISESGTFNQLMDSHGAFAEFITEYMDENFNADPEELLKSAGVVTVGATSDPELAKSFAEKVRPILERSKSRTEAQMMLQHSLSSSGSSTSKPKNRLQRAISTYEPHQHESKKPEQQQQQSGQSLRMSGVSNQSQQGSTASDSMQFSSEFLELLEQQQSKPSDSGRLIQEEMAQTGSVKLTVYGHYFRKIGIGLTLFVLSAMILSNVFSVATSIWLSEWSNDALDAKRAKDTSLRNFRLMIYGVLGGMDIILSIAGSIILSLGCIRAAKILHNDMLNCIMFAPMSFFDTTPIGRLLNRFTKDVDVADNSMSFTIRMCLMQFFRTISAFAMISLEASVILIALIPILIMYYIIQRIYIASSRQLKRIESITRSPIYHHFTETVTGISTIKAYGVQQKFILECNRKLDHNGACFYCSSVATRWLSIRLEFLGYLIVFLAALFAVISRDSLSPGLAGLAVSYSLNITAVMGMFIRALTDLETNIVSIERLIEYTEVEQEQDYFNPFARPKKHWPKKGRIRFMSYSTRYRPGLDLVLRNIGLEIRPTEKIGVVGRTGAGKSSLTLALFRIIEPVEGTIHIDEVDITKIGLFDLRSRITIIPQDPVLFTGDLRMNLDPFNYYADVQVWQALESAHLKAFVQQLDGQLKYEIREGGENISVGQRQLICLARALLRKTKILVLDEATAAVDMETDELIQQTIRREFDGCTIVTIAHRLNTVIDYDRILVLDAGQVAEFDPPQTLLKRTDSIFHSMAKAAKLI